MRKTNLEIAEQVKAVLVEMTANDTLPSDMTTLDVTFIEDILNKRDAELEEDKPYEDAEQYLCDDSENGMNVRQMVDAISQQADIDGSRMIDHVDGVLVWEAVEYRFTCDDFLDLIGL